MDKCGVDLYARLDDLRSCVIAGRVQEIKKQTDVITLAWTLNACHVKRATNLFNCLNNILWFVL